ncbi:MAG: homoserine O-succinyltransferase [Oscillospiraceae bacterium]|jgi:homoserine O-succinyltransferase|nr:homoserine O-succinyltransferase [Oscillospiraceae bacterium]
MPIRIPNDLPATATLQGENIFVMEQTRAVSQDIRPLEILILNLMPTKIETETQFARLLGNSPLQVNLEFLHTRSHVAKNISAEHLFTFYKTFDEVRERRFDGMIITGAPVEHLAFEDVEYWDELCEIMDWSHTNVYSTLHICWGAQAGLYHHYGIGKHALAEKLFGIFPHQVEYKNPILLRGFDSVFMMPHSRFTTVAREEIVRVPDLKIAASSEEAGIGIVFTSGGRQVFITGHAEYDADTLKNEYLRDKAKGLPIAVPKNYFPNDDETQTPLVTWRSHAHLLFSNWLNYFVYQGTPFDLQELKKSQPN